MQVQSLSDPESIARRAVEILTNEAREAVAARGRFTLAVSGGESPRLMLRLLARADMPWEVTSIFQVDERVAPDGDPRRNLTMVPENLRSRLYPMPVDSPDLEAAADAYAAELRAVTGSPPVLDVVHLGLGADGHTASLVPGDPVLYAVEGDVAVTGVYQGLRRMTLTYATINRARKILWFVPGTDKAPMMERLLRADPTIPAGRVEQARAMVLRQGVPLS